MTDTLRHQFVSLKSDELDTELVRPSNWNHEHIFAGGTPGALLTRHAGQSDGAAWTPASTRFDLPSQRLHVDALRFGLGANVPVTLAAPLAPTGPHTWTLPNELGAAGSILTNDGFGVLSWTPPSAAPVIGSGAPGQATVWATATTLTGDARFRWEKADGSHPNKALLVGTTPIGPIKPGNAFMGLQGPSDATGMQNLQLQTVQGDPSLIGLVTLGDDRVGISSWTFRGLGATNPIYGANFGVVFATDGVANGLEIDVQNDTATNFQGQALWLNGSTRAAGTPGTVGHRANAILIDTQDASKWEVGIKFKEGFVGAGATGSCSKHGIHFEHAMDSDFIVIQPRLGTSGNIAMKLTNPEFTTNRFELLNSGAIRVGDTMTGPAFPSYAFVEDQTSGMYMEGPSILGFSVSGTVPGSSPPVIAGIRRMTLGDALNLYPVTQTPDNTGTIQFWDQFSAHAVGIMAPDFIGNSFRIKLPAVPGAAGQCLQTSGPVGPLGSELETWSYGPCGSATPGGTGTVTNAAPLGANQVILGDGGAAVKGIGTLGTATTVLHGNAGGAPTFSAVTLTTDVTGRLPLANFSLAPAGVGVLLGRGNGSGAGDWEVITLGANLTMTGTVLSAAAAGSGAPSTAPYWTAAADAGLSAEVNLGALAAGLVLNTAGTPSAYAGTTCVGQFVRSLSGLGAATCAPVALATDVSGDLPLSSLVPGTALSVLGVAGNATADMAAIAAGADGVVLRRAGTAVGFGAIALASSAAVSGRLPYANLPATTAGALLIGRGSSGLGDLQEVTLGTNLSMTGTVLNAAGLGDVVGPALAIDSEVALFNGVTGKLLKRATGTGAARLTAGVLGTGLTSLATEVTGDLPLANIVPASAIALLLGRGAAAGAGDWQEVSLGTGLTMTGTVLTATGDVGGPAGAIDGEAALFSGTSGKLLKRATGTGPARLTAGVLATGSTALASEVTGRLPYANVTAATGASLLLGRGSAGGAGDWQEIALGANLSITGTTLNAAAGGGGAPITATYITQTPDATLVSEQALSLLATGYMLSTTATGVVSTQTATQVTAALDVFTSALKGLTPASGGGTVNFLRADGNWAAPAGGGNVTTGTLTANTLPKATGATAIANSLLTDNATLLTYTGTGGTTAVKAAFTATANQIVLGVTNQTFITTAGLSADRTFTLPDANSNSVRPLSCAGNTFVQSIASTGLITCGTPATGAGTVTNSGTLTANALILGAGTTVVTALGTLGAAGQVLRGTGAAPAWGAVALATDVTGTLPATSLPAFTGDVTSSAGSAVLTIAPNVVTFAKLQDMTSARFVGRLTSGTGDPEELTGTQATSLLDVVTSALKGLAPASGGGTVNFLRADGTWAVPAAGGSGNVTAAGTLALNQLVLGGGTTAVATVGTLGTATSVLHGNAGGAPTFSQVVLTADVTGRLPYSNLTAPTAISRLFGRGSSSTGDWEEITLGANLSLSGTVLSAASGNAPTTALYWTSTADAVLVNEVNMGALTTGLVLNTVAAGTGTPTAYGGTFCTSQFVRSLNASGLATCASIGNADLANSSITVTGTPNRVIVTGSPVALGGAVSLSGPQDIHTGASPAFSALTLTANANPLVLGTGSTTTVTMVTLTANRVFTLPDANSNPVQPLACGAGSFVSAIASTGVLTCTATSGTGTVTTTGTPIAGTLAAFSGATSITTGNLSGDVTTAGTLGTTIGPGVVTNAKLATMPTKTFKGRLTAGTGAPEDLTAAQAALALAPGGTLSYLRSDGAWVSTLAGAGASQTVQAIGAPGGIVNVVRDYAGASPGTNDAVGNLVLGQLGGSGFAASTIGQIIGSVDGAASLLKGRLSFHTHDGVSLVERMRIGGDGLVSINNEAGGSGLLVVGKVVGAQMAAVTTTNSYGGVPLYVSSVFSTGQMIDGFGPNIVFTAADISSGPQTYGQLQFYRYGVDDTSGFALSTLIAGVSGVRMGIDGAGAITFFPTPTVAQVTLNANAATRMALHLNTDNNTSYVALRAPATSLGNLIWSLPSTLGAAGSVLANDGAGNLSWASTTAAVTTTGTPAVNQFAFFQGSASQITSSSGFSFNPGTGVVSLLGPGTLVVGITPFGTQAAGPVQSTVSNSDNVNPYQTLLGQIVNGSSAGVGAATVSNDKVAVSGWAHRGAGGSSPIYGGNFTVKFATTGPANGLELGVINVSGSNGIGNGLWVNGGIGGGGNHRDNAILIDTQDASKWGAGIRFTEGNTGLGATGSILNYGIIFDKSHDADFLVIRPRVGASNVAIRITDPTFTINRFSVTNNGVISADSMGLVGSLNVSGNINTAANIGAVQYFAGGNAGQTTVTKTLGACTFTFTGGILTGATGGAFCG